MKHYGLWVKKQNGWLIDGMGNIIWASSLAVIQAQLAWSIRCDPAAADKYEIREFIETP